MSASGMLCPHLPHQRQLLDKEASQACHDIQFRPIESKFTQEFGNALDSYHKHTYNENAHVQNILVHGLLKTDSIRNSMAFVVIRV